MDVFGMGGFARGGMPVSGMLKAVGAILVLLAMAVLILGMVDVAQGEKGTWEIWPFYIIHGGISLAALVLFATANRIRAERAYKEFEGGEEL